MSDRAKQTCTRAECDKWRNGSPECVECEDGAPALEYRAEPAPRFRCVCGTEDLITREKDGTRVDKMRCPGCDRIWTRVINEQLSRPVWTSRETHIGREGDGPTLRTKLDAVCDAIDELAAMRNSPPGVRGHIESLRDQHWPWNLDVDEQQKPTVREKRLAQKPLKLRGIPCPGCGGTGVVVEAGIERACARCGGCGEIA